MWAEFLMPMLFSDFRLSANGYKVGCSNAGRQLCTLEDAGNQRRRAFERLR